MPGYPCCCGVKCPPYVRVAFTGVDYSHTCENWEDSHDKYGYAALTTRATDRPWCLSKKYSGGIAVDPCSYSGRKQVLCGRGPLVAGILHLSFTSVVTYDLSIVDKGTEEEPAFYWRLRLTFGWAPGWIDPNHQYDLIFEAACGESETRCQTFPQAGITLEFVEDKREAWWKPDFSSATATVVPVTDDSCDGWGVSTPSVPAAPPDEEAYSLVSPLGTFDVCEPPVPGIAVATVSDARIRISNCTLITRTTDSSGVISTGTAPNIEMGDTLEMYWGTMDAPSHRTGTVVGLAPASGSTTEVTFSGGAGDALPAESTTLRVYVPKSGYNGRYVLQDVGCRFEWQGETSHTYIRAQPQCKPPDYDDGVAQGDGPYWVVVVDDGDIQSGDWWSGGFSLVKPADACWPSSLEFPLWYPRNEGTTPDYFWKVDTGPYLELLLGKVVLTAYAYDMPATWGTLLGKSDLAGKGAHPPTTWGTLLGKSDLAGKGAHPNATWAELIGAADLDAIGGHPATAHAVWGTAPSAVPAYISLHTADPGATGANEYSGGGYARVAVTWDAESGGYRALSNHATFSGVAEAGVTHAGIWSGCWFSQIWQGGASLIGASEFGLDGSLTLLKGDTKYATS